MTTVISRYWTVLALLVAWQLFSSLSGLNRIVVPGPGSVFGDVVTNIGVYLPDLAWTLGMAAAGCSSGWHSALRWRWRSGRRGSSPG